MAERFRAWLAAQKYAVSTKERYYGIACKLCRYIGQKALGSVTPMDIGDFLTETHQAAVLRAFCHVSLVSHRHYDHFSDGDHPGGPEKMSGLQTRNADRQWQSCEAFGGERKETAEADPLSYLEGKEVVF
jgi:hypothetical protein